MEEWSSQCGTHVEGVVESVEGTTLTSINISVTRGTGVRGPAVITRLSRDWVTLIDGDVPQARATIRVVDAAYVADSIGPAVFRADRTTTAVWQIPEKAR